jgi:uncharacterized protein (TIGR02099 family)
MSSSSPLAAIDAATDAATRDPTDRSSPWRSMLRAAAWLLLAAWTVLLLAWLTLHWGILPRIEQWRPQIEQRASAALGIAVRIGRIDVQSSAWIPSLELRDVVLQDTQSRPVLALPLVRASLSPHSLVALEPRLEQLHVEGAVLDVRRDAAGRILVAGLDLGAGGGDSAAADWFLRQHELVLRGGTVRWTDETRPDAPTLALHAVDAVLRNGLRGHALRIDATPDAGWGERFTLRGRFVQPLLARPSDWRRWNGSAYAELPHADLRRLRLHVDLPFDLDEGDGALRAWIDVADGAPRAVTADLALRAVVLRLAPQVQPLVVQELRGRVVAEREGGDGLALAARQLSFVTGEGAAWAPGDLSLRWRQAAGQPPSGGEFSAQRLDLATLAGLAASLPLGDAVQRLLAGLKPEGTVSDLRARWDGPLDAPTRYRADARLSALALAAAPAAEPNAVGRPGVRNATLQVTATEAGGDATVAIDSGAIELPGVFEQPLLPLELLRARLAWTVTPQPAGPAKLQVSLRDARFANADAQGRVEGRWATGDGAGFGRGGRLPGTLELDGRIDRGDAAQIDRYLPLALGHTRQYLDGALLAGSLRDATVRIRGDLWDFPFFDAKGAAPGEFRIAGQADGVTFAVVPGEPGVDGGAGVASPWPAFTNASGEIVIDRASLAFRKTRARLWSTELVNVSGRIASLHDPVLRIDGGTRGPAADLLRYVAATPVAGWTGHALDATTASGSASLALALELPLDRLDQSTVRGSVTLAGNDVRLRPDMPALNAARGRVDFSERGLQLVGTTARALGGEVALDGGTAADGVLRFSASGTATADGLRRALDAPGLARLGSVLSGQAPWRATLAFPDGGAEVTVNSPLTGMAIDLPAPLRKAAEASWPLRIERSSRSPALEQWRVELGSVLQAQVQRDVAGDGSTRDLRGGIGIFEAAPQPAEGLAAVLNLPLLVVDDWRGAAARLAGPGGAESAEPWLVPDTIALRAQAVVAGTRRLERVTAGISHETGLWRANVDAAQLEGYVEYRVPGAGVTAGRLHARLARLAVPRGEVEQVESLLDADPATVPALDIVVDDFELRGRKLGRLEVDAVNRGAGAGREWELRKLALAVPEAAFSATGRWLAGTSAGARRRAVMDFRLATTDGGALLARLGSAEAIRGGKGELSGQVSWLGSPLAPDYPTLGGQMKVAVERGQFLKAEPGAARLLGVLSLQSLPRRLVLDFRDVFQEGFAFDSITGDVQVAQGVAQTNNLRMRGLQAAVLMEGSADLARETADLRVLVVPEIDAGTASLAYATINPLVGLGTYVAQLLFRQPLVAAGTREFHVTGDWADPKVARIERPPPGAASAPQPQENRLR